MDARGVETPVYVYEVRLRGLNTEPAKAGFVTVDRQFIWVCFISVEAKITLSSVLESESTQSKHTQFISAPTPLFMRHCTYSLLSASVGERRLARQAG